MFKYRVMYKNPSSGWGILQGDMSNMEARELIKANVPTKCGTWFKVVQYVIK